MKLAAVDWVIIGFYGLVTLSVGLWMSRRAGKNIVEYFVAGRTLPWWLAGTSIAATWFASDAPLAAVSLIRKNGIYANWLWWYLGAGVILTVFFYARLWRRSQIITDAEFIELRYSGRAASVLRVFKACYEGLLRNCITMGWVMLAIVKFSKVALGWDTELTLLVCISLALSYTIASGLWGVVATDLLQFIVGMVGTISLAVIVLYKLGGPASMVEQIKAIENCPPGLLDVVPNPRHMSGLEFLSYMGLIFVLWVRQGEGGDGYLVQRLFATRDEKHAVLAGLWFGFAGIVLLSWPWVVAGLGSVVMFPLDHPELAADAELTYPMMIMEVMPNGLRGLLVVTFIAAFMSTMDTHLCWGASYMINDVYLRFIHPKASQRNSVFASRVAVFFLAVLAALTAWQMKSIERAWIYIIEVTAGIAGVSLLRWFWWRVNAWAEISAIVGSVLLANGNLFAKVFYKLGLLPESWWGHVQLVYQQDYGFLRALGILIVCTVVWFIVVLLTRPEPDDKLEAFYRRVRPGGWWGHIARNNPDVERDESQKLPWLGWLLGTVFIYSSLTGVCYLCMGRYIPGVGLMAVSAVTGVGAYRVARRVYEGKGQS